MDRTEFEALPARYQVQEALQVMAKVVAEFGADYIGRECQYVCGTGDHWTVFDDRGELRPIDELAPECLAAQVMIRLGYDLPTLLTENTEPIHKVEWTRGLHQQTREVLRIAQASQDGWERLTEEREFDLGMSLQTRIVRTWGVALARAEGYAAGLRYED